MNLNNIPQIIYVFLAFIASLIAYTITKELNLLALVIGLGGALGGLAQKIPNNKPSSDDIVTNIDKANINIEK